MPDSLMAVRITSFEVAKVNGDWSETTRRWRDLSDLCKGVVNCFWETWLVWHVQHQSRQKLKAWLNKRQEEGVRAAGKCPVDPLPKALGSLVGKTCKEAFPGVHSRVRTLILNTLNRDLRKHKAANGSLPGHSAILLHHQSIPSSTRPHPIPFDRQNATIVPPEKPGGDFALRCRVTRIQPTGGNRVGSIEDTVTLRCQGRRVQSQVAILKRIVSGEYSFRGSKLIYSAAKRKWFVQLAYRMPIEPKRGLDPKRVAVLSARRNHPWMLLLPDGKRKWIGGRGDYVVSIRKSLLMRRWGQQDNYRHAGHANKGHGRKRAQRDGWRLRQAWKHFTDRCCHGWTKQVVDWCLAERCKRLVYLQPEGERAESRFLHNAGKVAGRDDSTGWPWFDIGTKLAYKCQQNGIELEVRKVPKARKTEAKPAKGKGMKRVREDEVKRIGK